MRTKEKTAEHFARCEEIRLILGLSASEFSYALGYNTGVGYTASTRGGANMLQRLAAEGLLALRGPKPEPAPAYLLLSVYPGGHISHKTLAGKPGEISLNGKHFMLIENDD